jgi:hypothetical protein
MTTIAVVYNNLHGGFGLSDIALCTYNEKRTRAGLQPVKDYDSIARTDPLLVEVVRELGNKVNDEFSDLKIKEFPVEYATCYEITQYDGLERVMCDPVALVGERLAKLDLTNMNDNECRETLSSLINLIKPLDV